MKPLKMSCDTEIIKICALNKDKIDYINDKFSKTYPFLIPSLVRTEAINVLSTNYGNNRKAKEAVEHVLKKLRAEVKQSNNKDIAHGNSIYRKIKLRSVGQHIGEKDCQILCSMKRLKVSTIIARDYFFIKEARRMNFKIIKIASSF